MSHRARLCPLRRYSSWQPANGAGKGQCVNYACFRALCHFLSGSRRVRGATSECHLMRTPNECHARKPVLITLCAPLRRFHSYNRQTNKSGSSAEHQQQHANTLTDRDFLPNHVREHGNKLMTSGSKPEFRSWPKPGPKRGPKLSL